LYDEDKWTLKVWANVSHLSKNWFFFFLYNIILFLGDNLSFKWDVMCFVSIQTPKLIKKIILEEATLVHPN
jgi:hypothetical protein